MICHEEWKHRASMPWGGHRISLGLWGPFRISFFDYWSIARLPQLILWAANNNLFRMCGPSIDLAHRRYWYSCRYRQLTYESQINCHARAIVPNRPHSSLITLNDESGELNLFNAWWHVWPVSNSLLIFLSQLANTNRVIRCTPKSFSDADDWLKSMSSKLFFGMLNELMNSLQLKMSASAWSPLTSIW